METDIINSVTLTFNQHYDFNSPSTAASIIYGGNINGWMVWKDGDGKSLHNIERRNMSE